MHSFEFSLKLGWSRQQYQIPYCLLFLWKKCPAKCRSYFTAKSFKFDSECVMTPWQVIFARTHPHLSSYLPPRQPKVATTNVSKCKVDFLSAPLRQRFLWQRARRVHDFFSRGWAARPMRSTGSRDWHLIGTIQFLCFRAIRQFGRAISGRSQRRTVLDIKRWSPLFKNTSTNIHLQFKCRSDCNKYRSQNHHQK